MKFKLLLSFFLLTSFLIFSQSKNIEESKSKLITINNVKENEIHQLQSLGIDLRCGAIFKENSVQLELTSHELSNLNKAGVQYTVEIEDLTKFYSERAIRELPIAKAQLEFEKKKNLLNKKQEISAKSASSISSVILDNYLQYYGENEIDWATPTNFDYGSMGGCLTVSEMEAQLDLMKTKFPNLITTKKSASPTNQKTYGFGNKTNNFPSSWPGQTVYFVKISDGILTNDSAINDTNDTTEPDILYTSMIHSRELSALMGNIFFMWYLLENYATNPAIKSLVDNNELYFVPIVNPDGLKWNQKIAPTGGGMQRKNLRGFTRVDDLSAPYTSNTDPSSNSSFSTTDGVDPNRNFGYLWGTAGSGSSNNYYSDLYRGPSAFSEPESQIMRDFVIAHEFKTAVWQHSYANAIPHPYGGSPTKVSGREDEMAKWHEDMTRYNRYIYGANVLSAANGIADDWMLGGTADGNGSVGSGLKILATTPENGADNGSEGGFWPSIAQIIPIAKRMVRINLMNAYYGGKYAKLHDLTQTDITSLSSNLTFGIERIGQTAGNFTLEVTPISTNNIQSITSPAVQTGMTVLQQRNITAALVLKSSITANERIEYNVKLKNADGVVFYDANFEKYYNPTVLFYDNPPDSDLTIANWVGSTNWRYSDLSSWSGSKSIKAGAATAVAYPININNTLTTTNSFNLSGADYIVVQFYAKWDLEHNFDFVELQGSPNGGTTWYALKGKYNKPEATSFSNNARSSYSNLKNSYLSFQANSSGLVYEGDLMDNWVMEEIVIDGSNNSALLNSTTAKFRFVFRTDGNNSPEKYSTTYDGFFLDDFKIIKVVASTLGIEDEILSTFSIYPNPVSTGEITIKMPNEIHDFDITVSNVLGQKVYAKNVQNNYENSELVNMANLKSGIYFITVSTDLGKATKKLIIQ
jgi:hypothetical protein